MHEAILGTLPTDDCDRDAIHVALVPVIAATLLHPAQHVGLVDGSQNRVAAGKPPIGIIDPFLTHAIPPETRCWLLLYPNTVTGMRHHWLHPAFASDVPAANKSPTKAESEAWLRDFVKRSDCPRFETLIAAATDESIDDGSDYPLSSRINGENLHFSGTDAHGEIPAEFWDHVENFTGKKCPIRPTEFSCGC